MKIGYTTGVFDLFHIGHLNILRNASINCDYLIVGIASDEFVLANKGKTPIIPYEERKAIVASIKYVDEVFEQNRSSEIDDWERFKFNVLFKGSDWKNTEKWIKLEAYFKNKGVEVVFFEYTKTTSSTLLREVLNKI